MLSVAVNRAGEPLDSPHWLALVDTRVGSPLSLLDVRMSLMHFFNTGLFENVDVLAAPERDGLRLTYRLRPLRIITATSSPAISDSTRVCCAARYVERFGTSAPPSRVSAATDVMDALLRDHGFYDARVTASLDAGAVPENATLRFAIRPGHAPPRRDRGLGPPHKPPAEILHELDPSAGGHLEGPALDRRVESMRAALRKQGYYEASIVVRRTPRPGALVDLTVDVEPGPLVTVRFEGDPIPEARRAELAPVQREASVDEDLLEDSKRRIEAWLQSQGHWRATADYRRDAGDGKLDVVFHVTAGEFPASPASRSSARRRSRRRRSPS